MNPSAIHRRRRSQGFVATEFAGQMLTRLVFSNKTRAKSRDLIRQRTTVPSPEERQSALAVFCEAYEDIVDTICCAAQFGAEPKYEARYAEQRQELSRLYTPVRPFISAFIDFSTEDADSGLRLCGRTLDAFEALTMAESLEQMLDSDEGCIISRLTRTQNAIERYQQHLTLLADNKA